LFLLPLGVGELKHGLQLFLLRHRFVHVHRLEGLGRRTSCAGFGTDGGLARDIAGGTTFAWGRGR
jgi:hypothetical protein